MQQHTTPPYVQLPTECVRTAQISHWKVELLPREPYEVRYKPKQAIIGFAFESQRGVHAFASDEKKLFQATQNGLAWVPIGCEVYSYSSGGEYLKVSCSQLSFSTAKVERFFSNFIHKSAIRSAFALRRALLSENPIDVLACESWLMDMESCVTSALQITDTSNLASNWVTLSRLNKIDEIIDSRLDTTLTVNELSSEMGVSAGFFSRQFKRASGRSPYQYIVDKRLARARQKLLQSEQSLSDIAFACGFSSHAHMTSQFRERLGVTPARLRLQR